MTDRQRIVKECGFILIGAVLIGLGLNLFLLPNELNAGGISGLAMVTVRALGLGTIGTITAVANIPLFILAGVKLGRRFLYMSILGMMLSSVSIDMFAGIPKPDTEPLIGALYGGVLCGLGLGLIFSVDASTGGSDIIVRLLKRKWRDVPIGVISIFFDFTVAILTGIVFGDINRTLYSGIAIIIVGRIIDSVVYRFDYSRVALVITNEHAKIAEGITTQLARGVTFLQGQGGYTHNPTKVVLTAIKRQQLTELKKIVADIDPNAFVIVQEAHQVLGDGFTRYSNDVL